MRDRRRELEVALRAVRAASRACRAVQQRMVRPETLQKRDKSPVTVADFASQAIVCAMLEEAFPLDPIVGEESAKALREDAQVSLRRTVVERVRDEVSGASDDDAVLAWIDRGNAEARGPRYWTLDPIDGTKGFLRGEQYAVALALIEDGEVVLGVLGCPNLPAADGVGALFAGERGGAASACNLWDESAPAQRIRVGDIRVAAQARFCESVESEHSDQSGSARVAELLGIRSEPYRIDSQCKYAAVARNDASIYLRLPTRADYREKIWDHAAGKLIVEAAGGVVTDVDGRPLDFTRGRTLEANRGVVATGGSIHAEVLAALRTAREEQERAS
ncbi:MAG TPA: 3'(2'),5'-bisphosphate nucleotidase [Myxococcota bacterium]|nr:3'(2'),5'-bisphosphate nucleotidase [Myxococcota bacterium]